MDEQEVPQRLASLMDDVQALAAGEGGTLIAAFAQVQAARQLRLEQAHDDLVDTLGEAHPQVIALGERVAAAQRFTRLSHDLVDRSGRAPRVRPHELLVTGEILDGDGEPLPGLRVRLYDRDVTQDDLLGDERTDARGAFAVVFHERDFAESGEGDPELFVVIDAPDGTRLADTRDQALTEPVGVRHLRVELGGVRAAHLRPGERSAASRCTALTVKGQRCSRRAQPSSDRCAQHRSR